MNGSKLPADARPSWKIEYSVQPVALWRDFPLDMVRYDGSTFADESSARAAERTYGMTKNANERVTVHLVKLACDRNWCPNAQRWESHGWTVL